MPTVTHEARVEDLPSAWRKDFDAGSRVRVTLSAASAQEKSFWDIAQDVAGVWADRSDAEIDALRADIRKADHARFDKLIPKD